MKALYDVHGTKRTIYACFFLQDTGLVYVIHGMLTAYQREDDREVLMYNAYSGEFVGGLSVLTGEPSAFTLRAKHNTRVAIMPSSSFYS